MIDIIIFSKNRACQLDALLRSIDIKFKIQHTTHVLYKYTEALFKIGYDKLISEHSNVIFHNELQFNESLNYVLSICRNDLISFFVDDIIMTEDLYERNQLEYFFNDNRILCISLRLGKNIDFCYALNRKMNVPNIANDCWNWRGLGNCDWGYPMSIDGNIYRREEFIDYIKNIKFSHPAVMEGMMANKPINKPLMMCFNKSKLINVPFNRVVNWNNRCMNTGISAEKLNELYLKGHKIKIEKIFGINNNSCHYEVPLEL